MEFSSSSSDEIVNSSVEGRGIGDDVGEYLLGLFNSESDLNLNGFLIGSLYILAA